MQKEIGEKIKQMRRARKMTLKELSEKTELSIGFLSMVERGLTSIALVSLKRIADALDEDVSCFFCRTESVPGEEAGICRGFQPKIRSVSGRYVYASLTEDGAGYSMDPMLVTLLPGQRREEVIEMTHRGEEFTYVLEGTLSYFLNGKEHLLYPGDSFHGLGSVPHNFVNLTTGIVKVLYIITPPLHAEAHHSQG